MSQALIAALVKLQGNEKLTPFSAFTALQRHALDELARKTGALRIKTEGRGNAYQVVNAELLATHLRGVKK